MHSGIFGGVAPDALTALCRLLATLHDDAGDPTVQGLVHGKAVPLDYPEERFRAEAGLLDSVSLIGTGSIPERLWARPAITVLGIDAPPIATAPNALSAGRDRQGLHAPSPGRGRQRAFGLLRDHLLAHAPWGAEVDGDVARHTASRGASPAKVRIFDAARDAFSTAWQGTDPVDMGMGGSIPVVDVFTDLYPEATILVTGVEDPDSRAHGANESLHLGEFAKVCLAEALLLANLALR